MSEQKLPTTGWYSGLPNTRTSFDLRSVYDLFEAIRKKPGIFIGEASVTGLDHFVCGFQMGLDSMGHRFEHDEPPFRDFHDWIASRLGFSESGLGWRTMLLDTLGDEAAAFERFFVELDAFLAAKRRQP